MQHNLIIVLCSCNYVLNSTLWYLTGRSFQTNNEELSLTVDKTCAQYFRDYLGREEQRAQDIRTRIPKIKITARCAQHAPVARISARLNCKNSPVLRNLNGVTPSPDPLPPTRCYANPLCAAFSAVSYFDYFLTSHYRNGMQIFTLCRRKSLIQLPSSIWIMKQNNDVIHIVRRPPTARSKPFRLLYAD
jgi:hypothetical protein